MSDVDLVVNEIATELKEIVYTVTELAAEGRLQELLDLLDWLKVK